jgi:cell division protein FtsQ
LRSGQLDNYQDTTLFELLALVDRDAFLNKVVSEIILKKNGDLILRPQVSKQLISWGKPVNNEEKLEKLKLVYHEIFPSKGWNRYKKVNLSYKDQIICE